MPIKQSELQKLREYIDEQLIKIVQEGKRAERRLSDVEAELEQRVCIEPEDEPDEEQEELERLKAKFAFTLEEGCLEHWEDLHGYAGVVWRDSDSVILRLNDDRASAEHELSQLEALRLACRIATAAFEVDS